MSYAVITTRHHPQTGARGARIAATWGRDRISLDYHEAPGGVDDKHRHVALALCQRLGKRGHLVEGYMDHGPMQHARVFVFVREGTAPELIPIPG